MKVAAAFGIVALVVSAVNAQQSVYGQCGGIGWSGLHCPFTSRNLIFDEGLGKRPVFLAQSVQSLMIVSATIQGFLLMRVRL